MNARSESEIEAMLDEVVEGMEREAIDGEQETALEAMRVTLRWVLKLEDDSALTESFPEPDEEE